MSAWEMLEEERRNFGQSSSGTEIMLTWIIGREIDDRVIHSFCFSRFLLVNSISVSSDEGHCSPPQKNWLMQLVRSCSFNFFCTLTEPVCLLLLPPAGGRADSPKSIEPLVTDDNGIYIRAEERADTIGRQHINISSSTSSNVNHVYSCCRPTEGNVFNNNHTKPDRVQEDEGRSTCLSRAILYNVISVTLSATACSDVWSAANCDLVLSQILSASCRAQLLWPLYIRAISTVQEISKCLKLELPFPVS